MKAKKELSNVELVSFCSRTALILNAGITPAEGMRVLLADTTDARGQDILQTILHMCEAGEHFSRALTAAGVFPDYVIHMVAIGEEAGKMDTVLKALGEYYDREQTISSSLKSALRYPILMIGMMLIVIIVLITKVLPIFNQVYIQLGSELTGFSHSLMKLGIRIQHSSAALMILLIFLTLLAFLSMKTTVGRRITNQVLTVFPLTRGFYEKVAAGRFANGMALTTSSGMDTYQSLDMVAALMENKQMSARIADCRQRISSGENFSEAVAHAGIFSNLNAKMIAIGFKTGNVDLVMYKIAENCERETSEKLYSMISILEPTLVIILSLVVGLVLLSVILPLMSIMSTIG